MFYLKHWWLVIFPFFSNFTLLGIDSWKPTCWLSSCWRSFLSKSKFFSEVKAPYSSSKALKGIPQNSKALMLTPHNLFFSLKWARFLLVCSRKGSWPSFFLHLFCITRGPRFLQQVLTPKSSSLCHSLLGLRELMLTRPPSSFVPFLKWVCYILSCPRPDWHPPALLKDLLARIGRSYAT